MNLRNLAIALLLATAPIAQAGPFEWAKQKIYEHPILTTFVISAASISMYRAVTVDSTLTQTHQQMNNNELDNNSPTLDLSEAQHKQLYSILNDESVNNRSPKGTTNNLDEYKPFMKKKKMRTPKQTPVIKEPSFAEALTEAIALDERNLDKQNKNGGNIRAICSQYPEICTAHDFGILLQDNRRIADTSQYLALSDRINAATMLLEKIMT